MTRLLEVINNKVAILYQKKPVVEPTDTLKSNSPQVQWEEIAHIKQFPMALQGKASVNFLFSPNFTYYIDCHFINGNFVIKDTLTETTYCNIPNALLSLSETGAGNAQDYVSKLAKRIMFVSENKLRIINKEGLDVIFKLQEYTHISKKGVTKQKAGLKIVSYCKIDNFDPNDFNHNHAILERRALDQSETLTRLIIRSQEHKVWLTHAKVLAKSYKNYKSVLLQQLYQVDYS